MHLNNLEVCQFCQNFRTKSNCRQHKDTVHKKTKWHICGNFYVSFGSRYQLNTLALVTQLDAPPTGEQEVVGLTPRQVDNILS